jgi:hypothetical protein
VARQYHDDHEFFEHVEELMPEGGLVFNYPYLEYPESMPYQESGQTEKIESYDMALGYLHTRTLRWSFGAMKGREWDNWQREVCGSVSNPPRFLERLVLAGFEGLLVDTRGINPRRWQEMKKGLEQYLGQGALREYHADRRLYFFDLRGHRDYLIRSYGPARFEAMAKAEREALTVLWLRGFVSYEPVGYEYKSHWCGPSGQVVFVNRSDRTITVEARMSFRTTFQEAGRLSIRGGDFWSDELEIDSDEKPPAYVRKLVIPPGRHTVRFHCTPHASILPNDSRNEMFIVQDFKLTEAK